MSLSTLSETGRGGNLLLIHGFPMTREIWRSFVPPLSKKFRVVTVNLPGFGDSPMLPAPFSLDEVASDVLSTLEHAGFADAVVVGHSLGGYVALAMAAANPSFFKGLVLFHSTAEADSQEKKETRTKAISFIQSHGAEAFTRTFASSVLADPHHADVPFIREMNVGVTAESLVGYIAAMRDRPDRKGVLKTFRKPVMFIAGALDQGISVASIHAQAALADEAEVHVLQDQKHMALIEDVPTTSSLVYDFAGRCN